MNTYDNPTVAALQSIISNAHEKIWQIRLAEKVSENSKQIGKFFKFETSAQTDDSDYSLLYMRVVDLTENGDMLCFQFETDSVGKIEIATTWRDDISYFAPITAKEFWKAYRALLKDLNGRLPK